ncbi:unnamed protein product [Rhizophagus irregularis]|uniref:Uncharacterized protein n=1 Tax=Rhizophagus irregularis TaxID=588596 RepID=A0A915YQP2_9GLOM|nr:unnamed protein product [Rhizophagus irregularis]CAB5197600.1 unnamed protein product [Rhizophagus irregularis]CAB5312331.1 unnamed protein product [Rhizophagus irregularis]
MPEERQPHILRTITEVSTRLGFALASWRRLRELKPAIRRVLVNLSIKVIIGVKKTIEYRQLQELISEIYLRDDNKNNDENCDNENNDDENSD